MEESKFTAELISVLQPELDKKGVKFEDVPKDASLIAHGLIDSITFVNLLLEIEERLGVSLDFAAAGKDFVSIEGLKTFFSSAEKRG